MRAILFLVALSACKPSRKADAPVSPASAQQRACARVNQAVDGWTRIRQLYRDMLPTAKAKGWGSKQYNAAVVSAFNAATTSSGGGIEIDPTIEPRTDCRCEIHDIDALCAEYAAKDIPRVICDGARVHEETHRAMCQANHALPPGDPSRYGCDADDKPDDSLEVRAAFEEAAYTAQLAVLQQYLDGQCPARAQPGGDCAQLARAKGWTSQITIAYLRTNQTSSTDERLQGTANLTSALVKPLAVASVNGYASVWSGKAIGHASFDDVEQHADGSPPFEGHANGPLVDKVPLGRFNVEILRIHPERCVYAFETSAVTASTWSDGTSAADGVSVQLGEIPIPARATELVGTKTLTLPVSAFDWPGPAATLPNEPIDWKANGRIGGSITLSWTFKPTP